MAKPALPPVRFAGFQFDHQTGELCHDGKRTPLVGQPGEILAMLLEHPGEVVSREELRQRLWKSDTFVEFEHSLNAAVMRLREALGDSAESPRFIETVPRRGYRFVGVLQASDTGNAHCPEVRRRLWVALAIALIGCLAVILKLKLDYRLDGTSTSKQPAIRSLAVLPLKNLSGNPEQEYLADGITDAIITELSKLDELRVVSRTSVMTYKGQSKPLPQIGKELNTEAIIEGSVQRSGGRIRISVQLIQAPADRHLWAETYDRDMRDVLLLQTEIANAIVREISLRLTPQEQSRLTPAQPVNAEAYELYLKGKYQFSGWRQVDKAIDSFHQAIEKDPKFAPAHAALATAYALNGFFNTPTEMFPKARVAANRAIELDPKSAEGYAASADIKLRYEWNWIGAEQDYKRALELSPNDSSIHGRYGILLAMLGRSAEAIAEARRSQQLDPISLEANLTLAMVYQKTRHYEESIAQFKQVLEVDPDDPYARRQLAWVLAFSGRYEEAIHQLTASGVRRGPLLAYMYARSGRRNQALEMIRDLQLSSKKPNAFMMASAFSGLDDKDNAIRWLRKAYEQHDPQMMLLKVDPWFDNVRSDPGFQALLRQLNFPR